ncbi:MAG TPA: PilZ domain-containing protein [Dongiaceae bacterium]|nr:PilZ domain-containing protein [Dongiaceae bacterium]
MSRVLMVDNAALFRLLEGSFLRRSGWEVSAAQDVDALLERARTLVPDLILLDAAPGFDAPATVQRLKADPKAKSIPILALGDARAAGACEAAGAEATLVKPVAAAAIESTLAALGLLASRATLRRPSRLRASVGTPRGRLTARLKDISVTGAFLALPKPLPAGTPLDLRLRLPLPEGPHAVSAPAIVVRGVEDDPGAARIAGVGVRFTGCGAEAIALIDRYVHLVADDPDFDRDGEDETR